MTSQNNSKASISQLRVTSLRPECLERLRTPNHQKQKPTHLLAYMSQFLQEKQQKETQQIEQYCCFDRIKRILHNNRNSHQYHDTIIDKEQQSSKITKVIQLEAKMKKMQAEFEKYTNTTQCTNQKQSSNHRQYDLAHQRKGRNFNKRLLISKIKDEAYEKYAKYQQNKISSHQQSTKQFIGEEIEKKVKKILQDRDISYNKLIIESQQLKHRILEKDLQIETLKSRIQDQNKKINQLEMYRQIVRQSQQNKKKQNQNQKLAKQFIQTFPNMTVIDVQRQIQNLNDKCLNKFYDIQCKNWEKWNQQKSEYLQQIKRLQSNITHLKNKENQLLHTIRTIRYQHSLATLQVDSLIKDKNQLQNLQKKILSLYNDWYGARTQSQKMLMKNLGYIRDNYQYGEMLDYIVAFRQKLSTNDKVNDYFIKVLRGIQRIRKILYPKQNNEKLDPIDLLQKLESYIKSKVYQKIYKKGANNNRNRNSEKMREQFMLLEDSKQNISMKND